MKSARLNKDRLTKITKFSKTFAVALFVLLPFYGFFIGTKFEQLRGVDKYREPSDNVPMPYAAIMDDLVCNIDSDCVLTSPTPCDCSSGGVRVSVNRGTANSIQQRIDKLQEEDPVFCPTVISEDPTCQTNAKASCIDNKCNITYN